MDEKVNVMVPGVAWLLHVNIIQANKLALYVYMYIVDIKGLKCKPSVLEEHGQYYNIIHLYICSTCTSL